MLPDHTEKHLVLVNWAGVPPPANPPEPKLPGYAQRSYDNCIAISIPNG